MAASYFYSLSFLLILYVVLFNDFTVRAKSLHRRSTFTRRSSPSESQAQPQQNAEGEEGSLFSAADHLTQLSASNIDSTLLSSPHAWIVNFYSTYCGHCQRFAPLWREFAFDVKDWSNVVRVAAITCSAVDNTDACQRYGIYGFPTLKFFQPNSQSGATGINVVVSHTSPELRHSVIDLLEAWLTYNALPAEWPQIKPISSLQPYLNSSRPTHNFNLLSNFLIVPASADTYVAQEVILDLCPGLAWFHVRWMEPSTAQGFHINIASPVTVLRVTRTSQLERIPISSLDRRSIVGGIRQYTQHLYAPNSTDASDGMTANMTRNNFTGYYVPPRGLYMQDLESVIYYMFWVEIPLHPTLDGATLEALRRHIAVLSDFYPGSDYVKRFINKVHTWLRSHDGVVTSALWRQKMRELEDSTAYVPNQRDHIRWTGCSSQVPNLRGYPCATWMLFHALTVNAAMLEAANPNHNPKRVLNAMKGYIEHFFGCRECATNFGRMAVEIDSNVTSANGAILWLWQSHNRANDRLHLDPTEDMQHPKVQFPPHDICADCRLQTVRNRFDNSTAWDLLRVVQFLKMFYHKDNIIHDATRYGGSTIGDPASSATRFSILTSLSALSLTIHLLLNDVRPA